MDAAHDVTRAASPAPFAQRRRDGYVLSDDRTRLDTELITRWLLEEAYWTAGRSVEDVRRSFEHSFLYGVLDAAGETVACARVVTDEVTFAWICDVFVDARRRGRGLGTWMVGEVVAHWRTEGVRRMMLGTRDAHEVYSRVGFEALAHPERMMQIDLRPQF